MHAAACCPAIGQQHSGTLYNFIYLDLPRFWTKELTAINLNKYY